MTPAPTTDVPKTTLDEVVLIPEELSPELEGLSPELEGLSPELEDQTSEEVTEVTPKPALAKVLYDGSGQWAGTLSDRPFRLEISMSGDTLSGTFETQIGPNRIHQALSGTAQRAMKSAEVEMTTQNGLYRLVGRLSGGEGSGVVFVRGKNRGNWSIRRTP